MRTRNSKKVQYERGIHNTLIVRTWQKELGMFVYRYSAKR